MNDVDRRRSPADRTLLIWTSVVVALLSTFCSFASDGFLEADGVTHYLYARNAFQTPAFFVDIWARPLRMLVHAVPAQLFGLHGVRAASLLIAIAIAWLTAAIAARLRMPMPYLAGFFVLAQPLLFLHSFSELTELPFALVAAGIIHAMLCQRWWLFALLCGLAPAGRPEGAAFILLALVLLPLHRRLRYLPLVFLPLIVWNTAGWWLWGTDAGPWHRWLVDQFPYSSHSLYPTGPVYRFLAVLPTVVSPLFLPLVLIGTVRVFADKSESSSSLRSFLITREPWLVAIIPWGFLIVHTWLHVSGRMSSSGEPRYLLATAPFWGLLALAGWNAFVARIPLARPHRWLVGAALIPVVVNFTYRVVPLRAQPDARLAKQVATWHRAWPDHDRYPAIYATHPLIYLECDAPLHDVTANLIAHPPAGVTFVYDSTYASFNSDARRVVTPAMFLAAGWTQLSADQLPSGFGLPGQDWRIFISPLPIDSVTPTSQRSPSLP